MSRRDQIRMSDDELSAYLQTERIVTVATIGPDGRPHTMPLWFVAEGTVLTGWTYAKSQKTKNLERDPRATLQVESGIDYAELKGVMLECHVAIEREPEEVAKYGMALFGRYVDTGGAPLPDAVAEMVTQQAPKRVGLRFTPTRIVSWDHSKLGGTY